MSYTIAVAGKGGTGKTTCAAFLVDYLARKKSGSVLALDADPNSTLNQALGVDIAGTIVGILDKIASMRDGLPAGMTKDRYIEYEVQNSISEGEGFDLLAMGRPEGPGCYCYANNVLRGVIEKLSRAYDFVVIDNEAGMEHLSRRTARSIDALLIISDFSKVGVRSAKRISDLAREMGIGIKEEFFVVNMSKDGAAALKNEIDKSGLNFIGAIPFDEEIERLSLDEVSVTGALRPLAFKKAFEDIMSHVKLSKKETVKN